jgi:hypothetical protein
MFINVPNPYPLVLTPDPEVIPADVGDSTCITVTRGCDETVRTLICDTPCDWNGRTDDGLFAPPGVYDVLAQDCNNNDILWAELRWIADENLIDNLPDYAPLAVTDSEGRFSIRRCLIRFGLPFDCPDDHSELCEVAGEVTVFAWQGNAAQGNTETTIVNQSTSDITIQFEE